MIAGSGNAGLRIVLFHFGLVPDQGDFFRSHSRNIEVLTKAGILLQPVLVVALKSVDLSVLKAEKGHSAVHFIVVFHIVYAIVLRQSALQRKIESIIGGVPDSKDIDSVFMKLNAEIAVVYREMR